jgi:hypothetical protein
MSDIKLPGSGNEILDTSKYDLPDMSVNTPKIQPYFEAERAASKEFSDRKASRAGNPAYSGLNDGQYDVLMKDLSEAYSRGGSGEYEKRRTMWMSAIAYSQHFGKELPQVLENLDYYDQEWIGRTKGDGPSWWQAIGDSLKASPISVAQAKAAWEWRKSGGTDEALKSKIVDYQKQLEALTAYPKPWEVDALKYGADRNFIQKALSEVGSFLSEGVSLFAESSGYMAEVGAAGTAGGAAGAAAGISVGAALPLPAGAVTVGMFSALGATTAAFNQARDLVIGMEYYRMRENGIRDDIAAPISSMSAGIQGIVEASLGNIGGMIGRATGGKSTTIAGNVIKNLVIKGRFGAAAKTAMGVVAEAGGEFKEETAQSLTGSAADYLAASLENKKRAVERLALDGADALTKELVANDVPYETASKVASDAWQSGIAGFQAALIGGLPGGMMDFRGNIKEAGFLRDIARVIPTDKEYKDIAVSADLESLKGMDEKQRDEALAAIRKSEQEKLAEQYSSIPEDNIVRNKTTGALDTDTISRARPDGTVSETLLAGNRETGARYASLDYDVSPGEGNVKILLRDVKASENIGLELMTELGAKYSGFAIETDELSSPAAIELSERATAANPNGPDAGAQWFPQAPKADDEAKAFMRARLVDSFAENMTAAETEVTIAMHSARAVNMGIPFKEYLSLTFTEGIVKRDDAMVKAAFEKAHPELIGKGTYRTMVGYYDERGNIVPMDNITKDARAMVYLTGSSNFKSFLHESAHIWRRQTVGTELGSRLEKIYGVRYGSWTEAQEERYALDHEQWTVYGKVRTPEMEGIFWQISQWMKSIFAALKISKAEISPEIDQAMADLFKAPESPLSREAPVETATETQEGPVAAPESKIDQTVIDTPAEPALAQEPAKQEAKVAEPVGREPNIIERNEEVLGPNGAGMLDVKESPVAEVPLDKITFAPDLPQFKKNSKTDTGVVEALPGDEYIRLPMRPITLWHRTTGEIQVVTGRHRLDLARRLGEKTIPAQVVEEDSTHDLAWASTFDAESNILDNQGDVDDYVSYFRRSSISAEKASGRGLLRTDKGRQGFSIGRYAGEVLLSLYRDDRISAAKASAIAEGAPNDDAAQAAAIARARDLTPPELNALSRMLHENTSRVSTSEQDMFGFDDSAVQEAEKVAKAAMGHLSQITRRRNALDAIRKAGKAADPNDLKEFGVESGDPAAMKARVDEYDVEIARWKGWITDSELMSQARQWAGVGPGAAMAGVALFEQDMFDGMELEGKVVAQFGLTEDPNEAGFILFDGRMVDFSGKGKIEGTTGEVPGGTRRLPHEAIRRIDGLGKNAIVDFMVRSSAIQVDFERGAVYSVGIPSTQQVARIAKSVKGDIWLYLDSERGEFLGKKLFTSPAVADIEAFYRNPVKPEQFSLFERDLPEDGKAEIREYVESVRADREQQVKNLQSIIDEAIKDNDSKAAEYWKGQQEQHREYVREAESMAEALLSGNVIFEQRRDLNAEGATPEQSGYNKTILDYAVVARSSREPGKYQISIFDKRGAKNHFGPGSMKDVLPELLSYGFVPSNKKTLDFSEGDALFEIERMAASTDPKDAKPEDFISQTEFDKRIYGKYFDNKTISSRTTPVDEFRLREGMWIVSEYNTNYGHIIGQLRLMDTEALVPSEDMVPTNTEGRGYDSERYAQWMVEGKTPPPIDVLEQEKGTLSVIDGHRRYFAAKRNGQKVWAWVWPIAQNPTYPNLKTGLTYEMSRGQPWEGSDNKTHLFESEPAVPEGMARLYRGETSDPNAVTNAPEWMRSDPQVIASRSAEGRWFSSTRELAEYYVNTFGLKDGRVTYIDIPASDLEKYRASNLPEGEFSAAGLDEHEFFVSSDLAAGRKGLLGDVLFETIEEASTTLQDELYVRGIEYQVEFSRSSSSRYYTFKALDKDYQVRVSDHPNRGANKWRHPDYSVNVKNPSGVLEMKTWLTDILGPVQFRGAKEFAKGSGLGGLFEEVDPAVDLASPENPFRKNKGVFADLMEQPGNLDRFLKQLWGAMEKGYDPLKKGKKGGAIEKRLSSHPFMLYAVYGAGAGKGLTGAERQNLLSTIRRNELAFKELYADTSGNMDLLREVKSEREGIVGRRDIKAPKMKGYLQMTVAERTALLGTIRDESVKTRIRSGAITDDEILAYIGRLNEDRLKLREARKKMSEGAGREEGLREALDSARAESRMAVRQVVREIKTMHLLRAERDGLVNAALRPLPESGIEYSFRSMIEYVQQYLKAKKWETTRTEAGGHAFTGNVTDPKNLPATMRKFFKDNPMMEDILKERVVNRINEKPMSAWSNSELQELVEILESMKKMGRAAFNAKKNSRLAADAISRNAIEAWIKQDEHWFPPNASGSFEERKTLRDLERAHMVNFNSMNMERFARYYMDRKNPEKVNYYILVGEERAHRRKKFLQMERRINRIVKAMKDRKYNPKDGYRKILVQGSGPMDQATTFSAWNLMFASVAMRNEYSRAAFVFGNLFSPDEKKLNDDDALLEMARPRVEAINMAIATELTDSERQIAEEILKDGNDEFDRVNSAAIDMTEKDLVRIDNYIRIERIGVIKNYTSDDPTGRDIIDELYARNGVSYSAGPSKGHTIERIVISPKHQGPINIDLWSVFLDSVDKQEHLIEYGRYHQKLQSIYMDSRRSKTVQDTILHYAGKHGLNYIERYIAEIANPIAYKDRDYSESLLRRVRGGISIGYLAWRWVSVANQLVTSPLPYLAYAPFHMLGSAGELISNPRKFIEEVEGMSVILRHRQIDPIYERIKNMDVEGWEGFTKAIGEKGMLGLTFADRWSVALGWKAVYNKSMVDTKGDHDASVIKADDITFKSQPSAYGADLSPLFRDNNEWKRLATQFGTQLNVIWQQLRFDTVIAARENNFGEVIGIAMATVLGGIALGALRKARGKDEPEEPEDWWLDWMYYAMSQGFSSVPLIGVGAAAVSRRIITGRFVFEENDNFPAAASMFSAAERMSKLDDKSGEEFALAWRKIAEDVVEAGMMFSGLPSLAFKEYTAPVVDLIVGGDK